MQALLHEGERIVMILSEKLKLLDAMKQRNEERIKRFFS